MSSLLRNSTLETLFGPFPSVAPGQQGAFSPLTFAQALGPGYFNQDIQPARQQLEGLRNCSSQLNTAQESVNEAVAHE